MKIFKKISFVFFFALIIFMPLQSLLGNILSYHTNFSYNLVFWLTHWYEIFILLFFAAIYIIKFDVKKKFSASQIFAVLLLVLGAWSIFFISPGISRGLQGFRFTLLFLIFYLFAGEIGLSAKEIKTLVRVYLISALIIAVLAIVERFLPFVYWNVWHIVSPGTEFGFGWFWGGGFWQSASIIGAPNQLASYLLPAVFILLANVFKKINIFQFKNINAYCLPTSIVVTAVAICLAFSRAALIGFAAGICLFSLIQKGKKLKIIIFSATLLIIICGAGLAIVNPHFRQLLTHGGQIGHQESLQTTWVEMQNRFHEPLKLFFGGGLGTAGPLAIKYGNGIISECWYLQVLLELGIVGLILWLGFVGYLLFELWQKKETGLFLGLIAVSVTAIFLHTWADNPALSYTIFVLLGLSLGKGAEDGK